MSEFAVLNFISSFFNIYSIILIIFVLSSWVPPLRYSKIGELLELVCEPYLAPFRKIIPTLGVIDISPIVAIFALHFIEIGLLTLVSSVWP